MTALTFSPSLSLKNPLGSAISPTLCASIHSILRTPASIEWRTPKTYSVAGIVIRVIAAGAWKSWSAITKGLSSMPSAAQ
ncbi:hypothetical protein D3C71_2073820 [compost metagenome]